MVDGNLSPLPPNNAYAWRGKAVGVNKWHGARAVKIKGRWQARVYENKEYQDFKILFGSRAIRHLQMHDCLVDIKITMWRWKVADTDGIVKPILDALQQFKIIRDDNQVRNLSLERHYHKVKEEDMIVIEILKVPADEVKIAENEMKFGYETTGE